MAQGKPRDPCKQQQWQRWIQLWQRSGLTVRAFCARHHLSEPSFYAWKRELQQRQTAATPFVPVHVVADPQTATAIEVVLGRGRCLRVTAGFDPATLRQLLAVLEETTSC
jgi:transposase-like protein